MHFPRTHLFIVIILGVGLCSFVVAKLTEHNVEDRFSADAVLLELPPVDAAVAPAELPGEILQIDPSPAQPVKPEQHWTEIKTKVRPGDNLALIFKRNGFSPRDVHLLATSKPLGARLKNIFPGHEIVFYVDEAKQLMRMAYSTGPLDRLEFDRHADGFTGNQVTAEPERVLAYKHGTILTA